MYRFLNNPEVKSVVMKVIVFQFILTLLILFILGLQLEDLKNNIIGNNKALIGKLLYSNPNLEEDIIGFFTESASKEEIETGITIANKYHLTKDLPIEIFPYLYDFKKSSYLSTSLLTFISLVIFISLILIEYRKIFKKINTLSNRAEKAIEGKIEPLSEDGEGDFFILHHKFNNMTNRLKLTIEALDKEKLYLKDIISDISHQLKTPLSSLMLLNDIMGKKDMTKEKRSDFLYKSKEQLERMEWLIISLLKMAKIEVGKVQFTYSNTKVINTIKGSLSLLKPTIDRKNQDVIITEESKDIRLYHDNEWLKEAFMNIIKNSLEHTPVNGDIFVTIKDTPIFTKIIIEDTGEGIKKEDLPNIFNRFYKASNSKKDSIGIGLSLAKAIIEKQNGEVRVESKVGEGTRFIITFLKI